MRNVLFIGILLFWYNLINYPKLWKNLPRFHHKITYHKYLDDTESLFNILKATSMSRETSKHIIKHISIKVFLQMGWYSNLITCFAMLGQNGRKLQKTTSSVSLPHWSVDDT